MNKYSKSLLLVIGLLVASCAQAGSGNKWFKKHPEIKGALVTAATITPLVAVPAALTLLDYATDVYRAQYQPEAYIAGEFFRVVDSFLNNTRILSPEEIFARKIINNIGIGVLTSFGSYIFAKNYPTEYLVALGLSGLAVTGLVGAAAVLTNA